MINGIVVVEKACFFHHPAAGRVLFCVAAGKYVIPKIVVNYADEGAATCTDVLTNIVLSKRSFKAAQGDKSMKVDLDGIAMGGIKINGLDA